MQINNYPTTTLSNAILSSPNKPNEDKNNICSHQAPTPLTQKSDPLLNSLNGQIQSLQKEQKDLSANGELSIEERAEKTKELKNQISNLEKQIQNRKLELEQKEKEEQIQKAKEKENLYLSPEEKEKKAEEKQLGMTSEETSTLIKANTLFSQMSSLNSVRTQTLGEVHRLQGAIAANKSRAMSTSDSTLNQLSDSKSIVSHITTDMVKKYGELQRTLKGYSETLHTSDNSTSKKNIDDEHVNTPTSDSTKKEKNTNKPNNKTIDTFI